MAFRVNVDHVRTRGELEVMVAANRTKLWQVVDVESLDKDGREFYRVDEDEYVDTQYILITRVE